MRPIEQQITARFRSAVTWELAGEHCAHSEVLAKQVL
jgi:hypothetical protein